MGKSVFFVGFNYELNKKICKNVADALGLFFLDINDLITYTLKKEDVIDKVGIEYYNKEIKKIILSSLEYEDTIINIPYDIFLQNHYSNEIKKYCPVIYIRQEESTLIKINEELPKEQKMDIALIVYEEVDKLLADNSNYQICIEDDDYFNKLCQQINLLLSK